jgi:hypothetical protein
LNAPRRNGFPRRRERREAQHCGETPMFLKRDATLLNRRAVVLWSDESRLPTK